MNVYFYSYNLLLLGCQKKGPEKVLSVSFMCVKKCEGERERDRERDRAKQENRKRKSARERETDRKTQNEKRID